MRCALPALLALCLHLVAVPAMAYTVYLKDGSRIITREKYITQGDKAILVLTNGTRSSIQLSEIDVARTESANRGNLGSAVELEGKAQPLATATAVKPKQERRLSDLISSGATTQRDLPTARRATEASGGGLGRTPGGYPDLTTLSRRQLADQQLASQLLGLLRAGNVTEVQVYQGSAGNRVFVEVQAASEAAVFQGMTATAKAFDQVAAPARLSALELLFLTPARERAGQFVMSPAEASDLASSKVDPAAFFVAKVQF